MFPWSVSSFCQCQFESVAAEIVRITGLDHKTAQKLARGEPVSPHTLERCPFPEELIRYYAIASEEVKMPSCEEWKTVIHLWQNIFTRRGADGFVRYKTTISSILWVEKFCRDTISECFGDPPRLIRELLSDRSPLAPFPKDAQRNIETLQSMDQKVRACIELYEVIAFPLYYASLDRDLIESGLNEFCPSPRRFLPSRSGKSVRRPMWHFFDWLREASNCRNWSEFVFKMDPKLNKNDTSAEKLKNWRNSKTQKTLPRAESVSTLISLLVKNDPNLRGDFREVAITAYSISRIMQIHLIKCTADGRFIKIDKDMIPEGYAEDFERWEKIGCRGIPLHPMFDDSGSPA